MGTSGLRVWLQRYAHSLRHSQPTAPTVIGTVSPTTVIGTPTLKKPTPTNTKPTPTDKKANSYHIMAFLWDLRGPIACQGLSELVKGFSAIDLSSLQCGGFGGRRQRSRRLGAGRSEMVRSFSRIGLSILQCGLPLLPPPKARGAQVSVTHTVSDTVIVTVSDTVSPR